MNRLVLFAPLLAVTACTQQVDGNYRGQPLAVLSGTMRSERTTPLVDPQVSLVWVQQSQMWDATAAEQVDAAGKFPSFALSVYSPPPDDAYDLMEGERYTVGLLAVGEASTDFTDPRSWYGVDFNQVVVYLPDGTQADGALEAMLHGAQPPGFHVYRVKRLTEVERQGVLDCINALPQPPNAMGPTDKDIFTVCGGDSNDELYPVATDLDALFDVEIVAEQDILTIFNTMPHW
jgi:hypothetical protein